jgi:hypothetical protein
MRVLENIAVPTGNIMVLATEGETAADLLDFGGINGLHKGS